tara:strand:- start:2983 stop:3282 length:300 start_codon:yes stop_codon:yes gene_type:complete
MTRAETLRALTMQVDHGGGAFGTMPDPAAFADGGLGWCLTYATQHHNCHLQAASVVDTFDYLLSENINMTEATRRLRQMRAARRERIRALAEEEGRADA